MKDGASVRGCLQLSLGLVAALTAFSVLAVGAARATQYIPLSPTAGLYRSDPGESEAEVRVTSKVTRGRRSWDAEIRFKAAATCTGEVNLGVVAFNRLAQSPVPVKEDGSFTYKSTSTQKVVDGNGTADTRYLVVGQFVSDTKVIVEMSVHSTITVQFPGDQASPYTAVCTAEHRVVAKHL